MHRASRLSRRDGGDAPGHRFPRVRARAVPSACLPFVPRWAGTSGRESRFACRVATASVTPSRERYGGLRRPGGPQSNRQFLPVVRNHDYAVRGLNTGGCGGFVGFIPAVNCGAFSSIFRNLRKIYHGCVNYRPEASVTPHPIRGAEKSYSTNALAAWYMREFTVTGPSSIYPGENQLNGVSRRMTNIDITREFPSGGKHKWWTSRRKNSMS